MNWIVVKKFPLENDLTDIAGYLSECKIQYRIYEEGGQQVIAVADPRMMGPVAQLLYELERGTLVLQKDESPVPEPLSVDEQPSFFRQVKAFPITSLLIMGSILGALLVEFDQNYSLVYGLSFQDFSQNTSSYLIHIVSTGEIWRLITPVFLHFGLMHILFNAICVWDFGRRVESLLGRLNYAVFFIIVSLFSNFAQYMWKPSILFGGISGVAYALVGFIMISHKLAPQKLTAIAPVELGFILFWLVLCMNGVLDSLIGGGVANAAHVGGLLAGAAYAAITVKKSPIQN